jgi:NitT/TauT family transport system ATP-binding protein
MKIENFNAKYDKKVLFSNFDLEVLDGLVTCILGPSGVGKTTLLNYITSVLQSQNKKVAVCFQEPRLFEHLTVYENLKLLGLKREEINGVLKKVWLENSADSYPSNLSGGEKQRVNFARAFATDSDVLLLDEPFFSLDVKLKLNLINLLINEKKGKTIVFVTHDIDEALMLSNKIVLINDGKILLEYKNEKPLKDREYGKIYEGRESILSVLKG